MPFIFSTAESQRGAVVTVRKPGSADVGVFEAKDHKYVKWVEVSSKHDARARGLLANRLSWFWEVQKLALIMQNPTTVIV